MCGEMRGVVRIRSAHRTLLTVLCCLVCGEIVRGQVRISEIRIDQDGADTDEYVELRGTPGTALTGLTYVVLGDSGAGGSGVIEAAIDLSSGVIPASGFFVIAESTFTLGTPDLMATMNFENGDNVTHLVVRNYSGSIGQDLDTNDDGVLDFVRWTGVEDLIAIIAEENPPASTEFHYGPPAVGPFGSSVPAHVFRAFPPPSGLDSWSMGPFDLSDGLDTPGAANAINDACDEAFPMTIPGRVVGSVDGSTTGDPAEACGAELGPFRNDVWYTFTGTGNLITLTTCGSATQFDTRLNVYCSRCDDLICVAGNDDGSPSGSYEADCDATNNGFQNTGSTVTFCSALDAVYRVRVHNIFGALGAFELVATEGAPCSNPVQCFVGACCAGLCVGCTIRSGELCEVVNGVYQGDGTNCTACGVVPVGACCLTDGNCLSTCEINCVAIGGVYIGDETDCSGDPCADLAACDRDGDGCVEIGDLILFLSAWFMGEISADFNRDGIFTSASGGDIADLIAFLVCYFDETETPC